MSDLIRFRDVEPTEAAMLADYIDTIYYALDRLRSGELRLDGSRDEQTLSAIYTGINDLSVRLLPRLQGIVDALIRAHYDAGGSHGELARAMDVERSTAQSRADRVRRALPPSTWERWATGELEPEQVQARDVRPGWTLISHGHHMQVSRVVHYVDYGHVSITTVGGVFGHTAETPVHVVPRDVPTQTVVGEERMPDGTAADVEIHERTHVV